MDTQLVKLSRRAARIVAAAGIALACGCQGGKSGQGNLKGAPEPSSMPATAESLPSAALTQPNWARETSVDVQAVIDSMGGASSKPAGGEFPGFPVEPPKRPAAAVPAESQPIKTAEPPAPPTETITLPPPAPEKPLDERISDAALVLTDLLNQKCADGGEPWRAYLALAALEVVRPGGLPQVITPSTIGAGGLSDREFAMVGRVRDFLAAAAALPSAAKPEMRAQAVIDLAAKMDAAPMRIRAAELCSKVTGYGQYAPLSHRRFLQGAGVRAIVYVEIGHFANTAIDADPTEPAETRSGNRFMVEVGQTLELYHDADGVLAWRKPEQRVLEISRNKRHDFFLVHEVLLPPTLTVGAYRLKISMKDFATDQTDEMVIPLEIVADAALAAETTGGPRD